MYKQKLSLATENLLTQLNIGSIELEPEFVGGNEYRFRDRTFSIENGDLSAHMHLEVWTNEDFEHEFIINNISITDEICNEVELTNEQYSTIEKEIKESITISRLVA